MPVPGVAQPDAMPFLKFRLDDVTAIESLAGPVPLGPSTIIPSGNTFFLRTDLGMEGVLAPVIPGGYEVFHHIQNIETGAVATLPPTAGDTFAGVLPESASLLSGPYTAGVAPLVIPPGFDTGTYRITSHVHPVAPFPASAGTVINAFHDGLIIQIV